MRALAVGGSACKISVLRGVVIRMHPCIPPTLPAALSTTAAGGATVAAAALKAAAAGPALFQRSPVPPVVLAARPGAEVVVHQRRAAADDVVVGVEAGGLACGRGDRSGGSASTAVMLCFRVQQHIMWQAIHYEPVPSVTLLLSGPLMPTSNAESVLPVLGCRDSVQRVSRACQQQPQRRHTRGARRRLGRLADGAGAGAKAVPVLAQIHRAGGVEGLGAGRARGRGALQHLGCEFHLLAGHQLAVVAGVCEERGKWW